MKSLSKTWCSALVLLAMPLSAFAVTFSGISTGTFQNPAGPPGMVTAGVGTNHFTWGVTADGNPVNSLAFAGASFVTVSPETTFGLGTLTYHNGAIALGTEASSVDLAVTLTFSDPAGLGPQSFTFPFTMVTTPNGGVDPVADADSVELGLGRQSVFSFGGTSYTLDLSFGNFHGNSLGDADTFRVLEQGTGTVDLQGTITTNIVRTPDTGSTLVLLGAAMAAIRFGRRAMA